GAVALLVQVARAPAVGGAVPVGLVLIHRSPSPVADVRSRIARVLVSLVPRRAVRAVTVRLQIAEPDLLGDAAAGVVDVSTGGLRESNAVLIGPHGAERHR